MSGRISEAHHSAAITRVLEIVPYASVIREHVGVIVASPAFKGSRRGQEFLKHIIEKALNSQFEDLKERTLGVELFGRPPAYDTTEDAVVRVTACDVRKRLTHFYAEAGPAKDVRIDLPPGSYIPEFHRSTPAIVEDEAPAPAAHPAEPENSRRAVPYRLILFGAGIAALFWLVVNGAASVMHSTKPALPWSAILQRDKPVQLILSDPDIAAVQNILGTSLTLSDYANQRYLPEGGISPELQRAFRGYRGANVASVDTMIALNISDLARTTSPRMRIHTARSMKLPDLKVDDNFILLGSPRSNLWTRLFEDQLDFVFAYDPEKGMEILRNKHPAQNEPASYIPTARGFATGDAYGIIGFVSNPGQSGEALLLAGSNAEATEAAGKLATNLPQLATTLHSCGAARHFEILLRVTTMAGSPNTFDVVACHPLADK